MAEEALSISVYCALTATDFRDGVLNAVSHSGDSDSTGAITGNILGTYLGVTAIDDDFSRGSRDDWSSARSVTTSTTPSSSSRRRTGSGTRDGRDPG